ncbi:hypothetical protein LX36DRAFT_649913 [Colletotrichum falcatum]|nr:hypothetical protein LX36DRAFT_649913 [Colletotrichum falcatum]
MSPETGAELKTMANGKPAMSTHSLGTEKIHRLPGTMTRNPKSVGADLQVGVTLTRGALTKTRDLSVSIF